jgi:hypothetical protein
MPSRIGQVFGNRKTKGNEMMTGPGCTRKHTPIVSERQRRLFAAKAGGAKTKAGGLSKVEAKRHLKEAKGKDLPESAARRGLARRARRGK